MPGQIILASEQTAVAAPRWVGEAVCRSVDPELFFDRGQEASTGTGPRPIGRENIERREAAKRVCARCPVLLKCREFYIDEPHGVYGGLDRDERKALREGRGRLRRSKVNHDLLGQEAFDAQLAGQGLTELAKANGLRTRQLVVLMEHYLSTPKGLRAQLEREVRADFGQGLTAEESAFKLGITVVKMNYIRNRLGLHQQRPVSAAPVKLGTDRWDSSVRVGGGMLEANYLGESTDGWLFMQVKYPQASTRKWMRAEDVHLGESVRRHVISKGVGSGIKRKRDTGDQGEVA